MTDDIAPPPENVTIPISIRVPKSLVDQADEISSTNTVLTRLDILRMAIDKGLPLVADMLGGSPTAKLKTDDQS